MATETVKKWIAALWATIGIAVGAAAVYGLVLVSELLWSILLSIDKEIAATIIATSGTVLVAVGTLIYSQRHSKERDLAEAHRAKKAEIYNEFMRVIVDVLKKSKARDPSLPSLPEDLQEFFYSFTRDSIVWASPNIIQSWYRFKKGSVAGSTEVLLLVDDILRDIRKDLGNSNKGLQRGHLIRLFVSDADEHGL
jgi:hypothetical protein